MKTLANLHQNYIVVPFDKASGNVAIICKKVFAFTLTKGLGFIIGNSNNKKTDEMINTINENDIVDKHTKSLNKYRLSVNEESKCLHHIYRLTELHKNPTKAWNDGIT